MCVLVPNLFINIYFCICICVWWVSQGGETPYSQFDTWISYWIIRKLISYYPPLSKRVPSKSD